MNKITINEDKELRKLGEALQSWRNERRWQGKQVADAIGISTDYLRKLEQGRRCPSYRVLLKMARFYEIKVSSLVKGVQ